MQLFLVDHTYGAALVYARSARHAGEIAASIGDVLAVHPFDVEMAFSIQRVPIKELDPGFVDLDGETATQLVVQADYDVDFEEVLEQRLIQCRVALDADEYNLMNATAEA